MSFTTNSVMAVFYGLLSISSLTVSVWAYSRSRRFGWLVLVAASIISISGALVSPAIQEARRQAWDAAVQHSGGGPLPAYPFPYEQIFWALAGVFYPVGLWLIARTELPKKPEPSAEGNATPPRASAERSAF